VGFYDQFPLQNKPIKEKLFEVEVGIGNRRFVYRVAVRRNH